MTSTRRGRRAEPTETTQEPTVTESTPTENTDAAEGVNAEASTDSTEAKRPGRKPMDEAEREKRATFRACQKATDLLRKHGFKVTEPDNWEDPEAERVRQNLQRALDAARQAGVDVSSITAAVAPTSS